MATFPSMNNGIVRFISNGWFIEMATPAGGDEDGEHRVRMVCLASRQVFVSKKTDWEENLRPFFIQVCSFVERGMTPVGSPKWDHVGPARGSLVRHIERFVAWSKAQNDETTECRGCEHCDGEGGHSVADSRRAYEAVERMMRARGLAC